MTGRADTAVAALCAVDATVLVPRRSQHGDVRGQAPTFVDVFRWLLDDRSIDAVFIVAPHHWHGVIALRALQTGK